MKTRNLLLTFLFIAIALCQLYGSWMDNRTIEYVVKPLILLWIAGYFLLNTQPAPRRWLVLLAFFFSWAGDLLLMFAWKNELFFFTGVGAFFASQVTYIQAFRKYSLEPGRGLVVKKPLWLLPFALYFAFIYLLILPGLVGIMLPVVFVYAISLVGMSAAAFNRCCRVSNRDFWLVFSGSLLFLASDSLLAINKFLTEIPNGGFLVMLTYIGAQYLIMRGLCSGREERIENRE